MIIGARYDVTGKMVLWWDSADRRFHDTTSGTDTPRPFTPDENAAADALDAASAKDTLGPTLRGQLAAGLAAITAARDAATADIPVRQAAQTAALALKAQADTFAAKGTFVAGDMATLGQAVSVLAADIAALDGWAAAVDANAVTTDNALLWLGTIAAKAL